MIRYLCVINSGYEKRKNDRMLPLGISKRGDSYLRKLLIHGARATLRWARTKTDSRSQWIRGVLERRGWNRTAVAVANKHARIVWALLSRGGVYGESTN